MDAARQRRALWLAGVGVAVLALIGGGISIGFGAADASHGGSGSSNATSAALPNPDVDTGTALGGRPAPDFQLVDQNGQHVSLHQFRGKAVVLAFVDSECTTICPLTTVGMVEARQLLGSAADQVQLLGIDANPTATTVADVRAYTTAHGMQGQWRFLTGTLSQLKAVWHAYDVYVAAVQGNIDHQPAVYVIDPQGREQTIFITQMAYAGVSQQAEVLAYALSQVLPGHPAVHGGVPLAYQPGIPPSKTISLPVVAGDRSTPVVQLGPGQPRFVVFVASWLTETSNVAAQLAALDDYTVAARRHGWPTPVLIDDMPTEPTPSSFTDLLQRLPVRLDYPVVQDTSGRLADGYGAQDQPWMVLTSSTGRILFTNDGWFPEPALQRAVARALAAR